MALLIASLLALLATAAHAQFNTSAIILGHNKSLEYDWASSIVTGWAPSILPDPLYTSPDACDNGNSGLVGLSFDRCVAACSSLSTCLIVAYYPDWNNGTSACFSYGTKDMKVINLIKDVADSATPVALRDSANKATVYYGIKQEGYGPDNWQNFLWATDTNPAKSDFFFLPNKLFTSADKAVCNGDPDDGIINISLRECIDLCLSIPKCLLVKYIPDGGSVQATTGRCYAHDAVPDGADDRTVKDGLSSKLTTYEELNDPAYVGISSQYFINKIGKP